MTTLTEEPTAPAEGDTQRRCWNLYVHPDGNAQCESFNGHEGEHRFTLVHKAGDFHEYRTACIVCGQFGAIHLSLEPQKAEASA